ncbi:MAG: TatD family hydrolase [Proteobacteria bacterium]|nr:TatD family hydrolase [Pseudomonadota bacterium]
MFDAHAHLESVPEVGTGWIVPGVDLDSAPLAARLAQDPRVEAGIGLHPWYVPPVADLPAQLELLEQAIEARRPCAIGETGLDRTWRAKPRKREQRAAFEAQIAIARRLELPLIIHCVRAHGACLERLADFPHGGMVHDFGGPMEMLGPWVEAGFYLSISTRNLGLESVVAAIPSERLLIETDDAGPERLPEVAAAVAAARGVSVEEIAAITESNARRLFSC